MQTSVNIHLLVIIKTLSVLTRGIILWQMSKPAYSSRVSLELSVSHLRLRSISVGRQSDFNRRIVNWWVFNRKKVGGYLMTGVETSFGILLLFNVRVITKITESELILNEFIKSEEQGQLEVLWSLL